MNLPESRRLKRPTWTGFKAWAEVIKAIRENGMQPPALIPRWVNDARELGLLDEYTDAGADDGQR